jgi:hypothetical protein
VAAIISASRTRKRIVRGPFVSISIESHDTFTAGQETENVGNNSDKNQRDVDDGQGEF